MLLSSALFAASYLFYCQATSGGNTFGRYIAGTSELDTDRWLDFLDTEQDPNLKLAVRVRTDNAIDVDFYVKNAEGDLQKLNYMRINTKEENGLFKFADYQENIGNIMEDGSRAIVENGDWSIDNKMEIYSCKQF